MAKSGEITERNGSGHLSPVSPPALTGREPELAAPNGQVPHQQHTAQIRPESRGLEPTVPTRRRCRTAPIAASEVQPDQPGLDLRGPGRPGLEFPEMDFPGPGFPVLDFPGARGAWRARAQAPANPALPVTYPVDRRH